MHHFLRDLLARTLVHTLVAVVFFGPYAFVGWHPVDPLAVVLVEDAPEGEPFGEARFLELPVAEEASEDPVVGEPSTEVAVAPEPELEPVLPPDPSADGQASGGSADAVVADGGTAVAGEGGEGGGEGAAVGPGPGRGRAATAQKPWKGKKKTCDKPHPNIRPGGDGVVEIDRALVDHYTKNLESFMKLGFSRPFDEGDVHGWYVSGFSCASPVSKAGFKRGDVLLSVNGKKTRSWVGVFMMYQKLKNKDDFLVELVRQGQPVTLQFRVVEGGEVVDDEGRSG